MAGKACSAGHVMASNIAAERMKGFIDHPLGFLTSRGLETDGQGFIGTREPSATPAQVSLAWLEGRPAVTSGTEAGSIDMGARRIGR